MEKTITFQSWGRTVNGTVQIDPARKRIDILSEDDDMPGVLFPYATCTAAVNGLGADEYAIKDWSENEGMLDLLVDAGIVDPPHRYITSGYVLVPVCRLREV